jgi:plasmid maintenance system antidote protein VapI
MRKERLREMMSRRDLNVAALAELSGTAERTLWRLLEENKGTTDETAARLARALQTSLDYLLGLSDDPTPHIRINNMTDVEIQVLEAMRRGDDKAAIKILASR